MSFCYYDNLFADDVTDVYSPDSYGTPNDVYSVLLSKDVLSCTGCVDQQFYNRECLLNHTIDMQYFPHTWQSLLSFANSLADFTMLTTLEQNWNLTAIPNPDGDGPMWDTWMLPFSKLKVKHD